MKRYEQSIILIIGLVIMLVIFPTCGIVQRSTTPSGLSSPPEIQLPEGKTQKLVLEDDFSETEGNWFAIPEKDKGGGYENGEYVLWVDKTGTKIASLVSLEEIDDFILEIDAKKLSGEKGSYFFIAYRLDVNNNMYAVGIADNSEYSIVKYELGRATAMLKTWTKSKFIKADDKTNRLKIVCIGTQTDVYVNGYKLATVADNASLRGQIGLGIKSFSQTGAKYSFDNFKLWTIE